MGTRRKIDNEEILRASPNDRLREVLILDDTHAPNSQMLAPARDVHAVEPGLIRCRIDKGPVLENAPAAFLHHCDSRREFGRIVRERCPFRRPVGLNTGRRQRIVQRGCRYQPFRFIREKHDAFRDRGNAFHLFRLCGIERQRNGIVIRHRSVGRSGSKIVPLIAHAQVRPVCGHATKAQSPFVICSACGPSGRIAIKPHPEFPHGIGRRQIAA
jgi:hypothetical protein